MNNSSKAWLFAFWLVVIAVLVQEYDAAGASWRTGKASTYGVGDGYMWKRTSCGKTVTPSSMFVAALTPSLAKCGLRVLLLYRGRLYSVAVQDRGTFNLTGRVVDLSPGIANLMHVRGVARIQYSVQYGHSTDYSNHHPVIGTGKDLAGSIYV